MAHYDETIEEDLTGKKFYDARLVRRLLQYGKPYLGIMIIAFCFLMLAAIIEVYLPYLSKQAIDGYIVANDQLLVFAPDDTLKERFISRYGGAMFYAGKDSFIINGGVLDPSDMKIGLAHKVIMPQKYLTFSIDEYPLNIRDTILGIITSHSAIFIPVGSAAGENVMKTKSFKLPFGKERMLKKPSYAIAYENLSKIPKEELKLLRGNQIRGLFSIALIYFVLLALSFTLNFGQAYSLNVVAQKAMHNMRIQILDHMQRLSLRFFDTNPIGRLVTRATNDINTIAEMFTSVAVNFLKDVIMLIGIGIILVYMNWRLSLFVLAMVPLIILTTMIFRIQLREAFRWVRRAIAAVNARISEDFAGIRIIQSFLQQKASLKRFDDVNEDYYRATMRMLWINAVFRPIMSLFMNLSIALIIWYGGGQVIQQAMTLGMLVAYLSYIHMFFHPIMELSEKYTIMQSAMAASERIFGILDTKPDITSPPKPYKPAPQEILGKVEFRNVYFAYVGDDYVLRDVSFTIEPGQTFAIVGATGAGKTTITALLSRLYDIQKGQILVDDIDIRQWDLSTLRKSIGVVMQDVFLFSTDIKENIRLHDEKSIDEVKLAATIVNASEFIERLPQKYDEPVAEGGATLSTGQRQLLSFARALIFRPKILVLDEATANIDTHTEQLIQDAIEKLLYGRTSIVVAHRLSTIRKANQILVMHRGRIVESGTHEDLLQIGGYYSRLYELQFRKINNNVPIARNEQV